jgi:hypothetical protein
MRHLRVGIVGTILNFALKSTGFPVQPVVESRIVEHWSASGAKLGCCVKY